MNAQTLKRLGGVLAALVVVWLGLGLAHRAGRDTARRLVLPRLDTRSVDRARIVHGADTLRFARSAGHWSVNGHDADQGQIGELLGAVIDTTGGSDLVSRRTASLKALGLDSTDATGLTLYAGDRPVLSLLVGLRSQDYTGVYVRLPGDSAAYRITWGQLADLASEHKATQWWNKVIAKVPPDSVARIDVRTGRTGYSLAKHGASWQLGTHAADSSAVTEFLERFRDLEASRFATPAQEDSARFPPQGRGVQLLAAGGRPLLVLRMDSTAGGVWSRRNGDSTIFILDNWTANGLTPPDTTLLPKPAPAAGARSAGKAPAGGAAAPAKPGR
jgi:hypothetical protein